MRALGSSSNSERAQELLKRLLQHNTEASEHDVEQIVRQWCMTRPKVGASSQQQSAADPEPLEQLVNSIHQSLDELLCHKSESTAMNKPIKRNGSDKDLETDTIRRIQILMRVLKVSLRSSWSRQVSISEQHLLRLFERVAGSVEFILMSREFNKNTRSSLRALMPLIHLETLQLLETCVKRLAPAMMVRSESIWNAMSLIWNCINDQNLLSQQWYKTAQMCLNMIGPPSPFSKSLKDFPVKVTETIVSTVRGLLVVESPTDLHALSAQSQSKRRKLDTPAQISHKADGNDIHAALSVLDLILKKTTIPAQLVQQVQSSLFTATLHFQVHARSVPTPHLFSCLLTSIVSGNGPSISMPILSAATRLFAGGLHSGNDDVRQICVQGLEIFEFMMHPRVPTLVSRHAGSTDVSSTSQTIFGGTAAVTPTSHLEKCIDGSRHTMSTQPQPQPDTVPQEVREERLGTSDALAAMHGISSSASDAVGTRTISASEDNNSTNLHQQLPIPLSVSQPVQALPSIPVQGESLPFGNTLSTTRTFASIATSSQALGLFNQQPPSRSVMQASNRPLEGSDDEDDGEDIVLPEISLDEDDDEGDD
ncbi:hypothetical protein SeMB42_g05429 [Synchytrium endobioticum]|uniref:Pre-rRNA-processing protein RIX1 n=1 Tax=Synchytrium endobioticum TaxID=286115 RepID=A0A507CRU2_9FUNG|nr:hypothetical protein SeMB42_g05429 [Synchytrium endobioticum]TPX44249.1 hypothetical protein SeLEV6574_g04594 [Synchytrium endobioticum]